MSLYYTTYNIYYTHIIYTHYIQPENVLLDRNGHIRLIDFGFAKKVPYTKLDSRGKEKAFVKTYTLCGTPG